MNRRFGSEIFQFWWFVSPKTEGIDQIALFHFHTSIVCFLAIACALSFEWFMAQPNTLQTVLLVYKMIVVGPINLLYLIEITVVWTRNFDFGRKRGIMGF